MVKKSLELANVDASTVGVRLRVAGGMVRPRFVEAPEAGDETIEQDGIRIFISKQILDELGEVEVGLTAEHEQLTVRPLES